MPLCLIATAVPVGAHQGSPVQVPAQSPRFPGDLLPLAPAALRPDAEIGLPVFHGQSCGLSTA